MTTILKGREAILLAEACKLDTQKKAAEERIKAIKEELTALGISKGKYKNEAGDSLTIAETEKWTDINPKTVFEYLKKERMLTHFPSTVKVQLTPLKKIVPETVIARWRKPLDPITRWSFR